MDSIQAKLQQDYEYHEIFMRDGNYFMISILAMFYGRYLVLLQPYNNKPGKSIICEAKKNLKDAYELFKQLKN